MNQYKEMLGIAIGVATEAHEGQTRENGDPYILHPIRVMLKMDSDIEKVVAILHDVIEDSTMGYEALFFLLGITQTHDVAKAIQCLTKSKGEFYEEYIKRIRSNKLAVKVKLADLEDNLNLNELNGLCEYKIRRAQKYHKAHMLLSNKESK